MPSGVGLVLVLLMLVSGCGPAQETTAYPPGYQEIVQSEIEAGARARQNPNAQLPEPPAPAAVEAGSKTLVLWKAEDVTADGEDIGPVWIMPDPEATLLPPAEPDWVRFSVAKKYAKKHGFEFGEG